MDQKENEDSLQLLKSELGEPLEYRATGRFLGAQGLGAVPLDSWGLVVLTPSRVLFRHFAQAHPLFGGKDGEVRWEVPRSRFLSCEPVLQTLWTKLFSGTPDHVALVGVDCRLALEVADDQRAFPRAWAAASS